MQDYITSKENYSGLLQGDVALNNDIKFFQEYNSRLIRKEIEEVVLD
jgi:hypothetical protein